MKKVLTLILAFVLVIGATVAGTLAYLKDEETVVNTFTVGKVAIKLDEAKVNVDGTYVTDHDNRVQSNEYRLVPGKTYFKDPTVTVLKGSEESYVRMIVTINGMTNELRKLNLTRDEVFVGFSTDWLLEKEYDIDNGMGRTYEFRYKTTVSATDADVVLDDLFETISVPARITEDGLAAMGHVNIVVTAQAIQKAGFDDVDAAWAAFEGQQ